MLGLLDFLQYSFYETSKWNQDNFYSSLTATAQGTCLPYFIPPKKRDLDLLRKC